jgi:hypothetical protein
MAKKKVGFTLGLQDHQVQGITPAELEKALDTLARFALSGIFQRMDPNGKIPIGDCELSISSITKSATLGISIDPKREQELAGAVAAVYKDLTSQIDRFGIQELIKAGRRAYG